jgi:ABC-type amino acid transport substrate-binding protein
MAGAMLVTHDRNSAMSSCTARKCFATLSRRELVDFSIPTFVDGASLLIQASGPHDFKAMAGQKIGVLGGTTTEQGLRDTLKAAGITADIIPAKTHPEGLAMLGLFRRPVDPRVSDQGQQGAH